MRSKSTIGNPHPACADGVLPEREEIAEHRRRWRRESYLRFGSIVGVGTILWAGLEGLPLAITQSHGPVGNGWILREPILDDTQALAVISTILTIIAAISVTLVLGARLEEMKGSDLVRIGGWFDAAASAMTLLAGLALALASSLLITELHSSSAWVAGVLALVCLIIAGSALEDRIGLERRGALGVVDLERAEQMRKALVAYGLVGPFPRGKLALVSIGVPVASSALSTIPAILLEPESLTRGYWVWAAVVQLVYWIFAVVYLYTASFVVWLLRALERPRAARAARLGSTLGVAVLVGPPFVHSLANDAVGFWLIYVAVPFAAVVALSYLPRLRGFNPYYWTAWLLLPRPAVREELKPASDEVVRVEVGGASSLPTASLVATCAGLMVGIAGVTLVRRIGRDRMRVHGSS